MQFIVEFLLTIMMKRLQTVISLISPGRGVIDVGTDHGYVPVALALNGYPGKIIASDVNSMPLSAARRYAVKKNVYSRIDFRLSDGLQNCTFQEVDTVVIAGMGGDLICSILDSTYFVHRHDIVLILQPMTKIEILRYYLVCNGWRISDELAVKENGKLFHILKANYQGLMLHLEGFQDPFLEDWELFTGKEDLLRKNGFDRETLLQSRDILNQRLHGKDFFFFQGILNGLNEMSQRLVLEKDNDK